MNEGDIKCLNTILIAVVSKRGKTGDIEEAGPTVAHLAFLIAGTWGFNMPPHVCKVHVIVGCIHCRGARVIKAVVGGVVEVYRAKADWGRTVCGREPIARRI